MDIQSLSLNGQVPAPSKHKTHTFKKKTFNKPTYCQHCTDLLWGLTNQGVQCLGKICTIHYKSVNNWRQGEHFMHPYDRCKLFSYNSCQIKSPLIQIWMKLSKLSKSSDFNTRNIQCFNLCFHRSIQLISLYIFRSLALQNISLW